MRKTNNSRKPTAGKSFKPRDTGRDFKRSSTDKPKDERKSFPDRKSRENERPARKPGDAARKTPFKAGRSRDGERPTKDYAGSEGRRPFKRSGNDDKAGFKPKRRFETAEDKKPFSEREKTRGNDERRSFVRDRNDKPGFRSKRNLEETEKKPFKARGDSNARKYGKSFTRDEKPERRTFVKKEDPEGELKRVKFGDFEDGKVFSAASREKAGKPRKTFKKQGAPSRTQIGDDGMIRLNKYLSNAGIASRREADNLIQSGVVKVNGIVVDQLGTKINPGDKVTYSDAPVRGERKVYLLLNKPKDYITTTDDPQERKTVMELIAKACKERVYPVGRLDRNTTGLLLFTNDGDLTTKLTHPKFGIKKIYHVSLNKGLKPDDFKAIVEGIELEDGLIKADDLAFVGEGKKEIGIEIHSGRNRIVRRIFEHLGYDVLKLDRVAFAGLTKKDLPRGKHRFLTAKEIGFLQMIG